MKKTVCFTGSRPQNLPFHNERDIRFQNFLIRLETEIIKAVENGYRHFISGMAIGVDTYAARIVLKLKEKYAQLNIILEAAIPCLEQDMKWTPQQKREYAQLLKQCDKQSIISQNYSATCYQKRNEYMVNCSTLVIAVTDGQASGTMNTVKYAQSKNKEIIMINPSEY